VSGTTFVPLMGVPTSKLPTVTAENVSVVELTPSEPVPAAAAQ
jgi:hypothetical protein